MLTASSRLRSTAIACAIGLGLPVAPAQAYPVDCAILLCLAGGWPASPVCQRAKAVFLTRLTPWPVEPPLQPWRCPMGGGAAAAAAQGVGGSAPSPGTDVAGDLLRSMRVHHVRYTQRSTGGGGMGEECQRSDRSEVGAYDEAGGFAWAESVAAAVPAASAFDPPPSCRPYRFRAVTISWAHALGGRGFEEVRY